MALYGDVVLRLTQHMPEGATPNAPDAKPAPPLWPWPRYVEVPPPASPRCFGLMRLDHCVGNVPSLAEAVPYITAWTARARARSALPPLAQGARGASGGDDAA